jgi:hypothetical protein
MTTVAELLDGHVSLTVESFDRLYLNGYVPTLQTAGQLVTFLVQQRQKPIPSPAVLGQIGDDFKERLLQFAKQTGLTIATFEKRQRKDDVATELRSKFTGLEGVYMAGVAQEKSNSFKGATKRGAMAAEPSHGKPYDRSFNYTRQSVFVNHYYFYLVDEDFGPAFIKVCTYGPFGIRVCLNGHEWAKRQLNMLGVAYEALDNGFKSCADPGRLQALCDALGPDEIMQFAKKWLARLPLPLTAEDRASGYDYRFSIWEAEVSRTQVFTNPVHGREFFEEVIRENLDIRRPDRVSLVFDRTIIKTTPGRFSTRKFEAGVHPSLHFEYKSCHVKQYFKENQALRTETTINNTDDFYIGKDISHLSELRKIGTDINRRLLEVERVSQACTLAQSTVESITHATVTSDGQRVPALRFGDSRVKALWQGLSDFAAKSAGLTLMCHLVQGFRNATLRAHVGSLIGPDAKYEASQMTYDLRRLKRKGLVERIGKSHRYRLTALGLRAAHFFSKVDSRLFKPASASLGQPRPASDRRTVCPGH